MATEYRTDLTNTSTKPVDTTAETTPCMPAGSQVIAADRDIEVEVETRVSELAGRVAANPAELPKAVAILLDAVPVTHRARITAFAGPAAGAETTTLRVPSPWTAPLLFDRPGRPFTPAESARAHRLAMIARMTIAAN